MHFDQARETISNWTYRTNLPNLITIQTLFSPESYYDRTIFFPVPYKPFYVKPSNQKAKVCLLYILLEVLRMTLSFPRLSMFVNPVRHYEVPAFLRGIKELYQFPSIRDNKPSNLFSWFLNIFQTFLYFFADFCRYIGHFPTFCIGFLG